MPERYHEQPIAMASHATLFSTFASPKLGRSGKRQRVYLRLCFPHQISSQQSSIRTVDDEMDSVWTIVVIKHIAYPYILFKTKSSTRKTCRLLFMIWYIDSPARPFSLFWWIRMWSPFGKRFKQKPSGKDPLLCRLSLAIQRREDNII